MKGEIMTVELFAILLVICSIITPLTVEGIKSFKTNIPNNVLALFASIPIGAVACVIAYETQHIPYSLLNVLYIVAFILANWLGSMYGYDKAIQTIKQISNIKGE